jgi:hypothetical protein
LKVDILKPPSPEEGRAVKRNSRRAVSSAFDHTAGAYGMSQILLLLLQWYLESTGSVKIHCWIYQTF